MIREEIFKQGFSFWDRLSADDKNSFLNAGRYLQFKKGMMVNRSAEECRGLILVTGGQIRVYMLSDEGREVTLFRITEGDVCTLSASCLLDTIAFDVNIEAVEDTEAVIVPSQVVHQVMEHNVYVELFLSKTLNERFSDAMWSMQQILFMGAERRVAIFLWDETARTKSDTICFTQDEIARLIGSAREVVSKTLNLMSKDGIVLLGRGKIKVIDKEKLRLLV